MRWRARVESGGLWRVEIVFQFLGFPQKIYPPYPPYPPHPSLFSLLSKKRERERIEKE
jgi:hypothetical protein